MMPSESRDVASQLVADPTVPVKQTSDLCLGLDVTLPLLERLRSLPGLGGPVRAAIGILLPLLRSVREHLGCGS